MRQVRWGGQEHRVLAELVGFKQRGSEVWLLAPDDAEVRTRAEAAGISTAPFNDAKWRYPFEAVRLACWLRRIKPDVLNTHSSRDGWLVGLAGRLARVPLIVRTRHVDVGYSNPRISRHAFTTFADLVLTTSDRITAHLRETFQLPAERVVTMPTGIDLSRLPSLGARLPAATTPFRLQIST